MFIGKERHCIMVYLSSWQFPFISVCDGLPEVPHKAVAEVSKIGNL